MGVLRQLTGCFARAFAVRWIASVLAFSLAGVVSSPAAVSGGAVSASERARAWNAALAARSVFEAELSGTHTRASYSHVMDRFRAIYHADPADPYAARAVAQVAELLAEQGREFHEGKGLQDAAGQYEFLARAYPASGVARDAHNRAVRLLGGEKTIAESNRHSAPVPAPAIDPKPVSRAAPEPDSPGAEPVLLSTASPGPPPAAAVATVTAIRHWSTPSYTRVAIDLGDEVQFQAARVENPDRIFFDIHHARLAPQLAGKSFAVTDEGFLTRIRAAQFSADVTRVVLDVHKVAEYSAFLLPNPYRLIIDIHGKPETSETSVASGSQSAAEAMPPTPTTAQTEAAQIEPARVAPAPRPAELATAAPPNRSETDHYIPRRSRMVRPAPAESSLPPAGAAVAETGTAADGYESTERSSLPPMPVTDGGAAFGLPTRKAALPGAAASVSTTVAAPRVVISSRPTTARPVPNAVATRSAAAGTEVAAVSEQPGKVEATRRPTSQPVVDLSNRHKAAEAPPSRTRKTRTAADAEKAEPVPPAPPTAEGETSLLRALGLKIGRIVIDAGHGGHDSGTIGVDGIEEKDVVLDVALRLGKLLHDRLGAEIVYTRADDTFVPLETRTAIANKAQADLFISVHANSSADPAARGVEVYYLNFTSDPEAMQVASRENAVSTKSVHELSDLVRRIALKDKIDESHELAADVDESLYAGLAKGNGGSGGLKDRGVKKAPFVVLIGANMPSILAEISFVTNPKDAAELSRPAYRERVAESLFAGVARYASSINGRQTGTRFERAER